MVPRARAYVAITGTNNLETIAKIAMGCNARPHLYFQWLGCSKNDTQRNLNVNNSMFFNHIGKLTSGNLKAPGALSRNCFELLVKSITAFATVRSSRCWDWLQLVLRAHIMLENVPGSSVGLLQA
jgi:hypothetical protein